MANLEQLEQRIATLEVALAEQESLDDAPGSFGEQYPYEMFPDMNHYSFGPFIQGTSVKIHAGWVVHHEPDGSTLYVSVAEDTEALTNSTFTVIFCQYTIRGAATIEQQTGSTESLALNAIDDTNALLKVPLCCFERDGDAVTLIRLYHVGNIDIIPISAA